MTSCMIFIFEHLGPVVLLRKPYKERENNRKKKSVQVQVHRMHGTKSSKAVAPVPVVAAMFLLLSGSPTGCPLLSTSFEDRREPGDERLLWWCNKDGLAIHHGRVDVDKRLRMGSSGLMIHSRWRWGSLWLRVVEYRLRVGSFSLAIHLGRGLLWL